MIACYHDNKREHEMCHCDSLPAAMTMILSVE